MKSYQVNNFESEIICKEITTPSDPGSGYRKIYPKSDGWYVKSGSIENDIIPTQKSGSSGAYTFEILASTHGITSTRNIDVKAFEGDEQVKVGVDINSSGDITIKSVNNFVGNVYLAR